MNFPPQSLEPAPHISRDGLRVVSPPPIVPAGPPVRAIPPTARIDVLDREAARERNPLLLSGSIVRLWQAIDGPITIRGGDRKLYVVTPCEQGTEPTDYLDADTYAAIVGDADAGHDDDGSATSDEWTAEGLKQMRLMLQHAPPNHGIHTFQGTPAVAVAQAVALARWYGAPVAEISAALGHPVTLARSLLEPGGKAESLTLARRKQEAAAERATAEESARVEKERRPNTRTLADLSLSGVAVPLLDIDVQVPRSLTGLTPTWTDESGAALFVWRDIVGLPLPTNATFAGCHTLDRSRVVACVPANRLDEAREAAVEVFQLTLRLRRKLMPNADRGPIETWSTDGIESAKALVAAWAHVIHSPKHGQAWIPRHIVECVVRGLLVAPAKAARLVFDALEREHARFTGERPMRVKGKPIGSISALENLRQRGSLEVKGGGSFDTEPDPDWTPPSYRGAVGLHDIAQWSAEAAAGGEVEAGSLMPKNDTTKKKSRDGK